MYNFLVSLETVEYATKTAESISDLGMLAVSAGFFLVLSAALMITCFIWFKNIINNMISTQQCTMKELLNETKTQNEQLSDIVEGLRSKTLLEIKNFTKTCFDLSIERVCQIIDRVKEENNIKDKVATEAKVLSLLTNEHNDRNTRFDDHRYHGKSLSEYTSKEWIDWVNDIVLSEVYNEYPSKERMRTNVKLVYDRIRIDMYQRLNS